MQSGAAVAAGGAGDDSHLHDNLFFTFFNPEQEGFLYKQGGRMRSWKKRYCIVAGGCLYYFKHEVQTDIPNASCLGENCNVDDRPCGIIPLENLQIQHYRTKPLLGRERFYIKLSPTANADTASAGVSSSAIVKAAKTRSDGRMIAGRHRYYLFRCASADEQQDWLRSIETQMSQTTTPAAYQLYRERRKKLM
jgi:cytohesin